ncbi:unnamed protein product [Closterium sp. NIES-64]|nr:unnamed protein product [Closterium sp. NIES-64]
MQLPVLLNHFLSVCPTTLPLTSSRRPSSAEKSIVAIGASRGDPRTHRSLRGVPPPPFCPLFASAAAADLVGLESVGAASAPSGRRRTGKGNGGNGAGGAGGGGGGGGGGNGGVGVVVGVVAGVEVSVAAVEAEAEAAMAVGAEVAEVAAEEEAAAEEAELVRVALRRGSAPVVLPEAAEIPCSSELSRVGVAIFDLDFDAILAAMYAVTISDEGDCYRCFPPDPGIETTALGTGEAAALGASEAVALGASASTSSGAGESALSVALSLADPSGGPVLAHFSTVLPCPAAPSGTLSGLYLPSFSTNLVSGADLQDAGVHQFTPASQRVTHCTDARTGRHLATFTRRPGSSLYTLTTEAPPVPASGKVAASGQVFAAASRTGPESAPCSCRLLSHETLLWHPPPWSPLPASSPRHGLTCPCLWSSPAPPSPSPGLPLLASPCVEGRQRAAPHSSQFPPTEAPLQTLHMDVWGPARVRGQGHERFFLLVVDDYSRYTTVFPLRSKGDVTEVLIDWIRAARLQLRQSFGSGFLVLRLHSDRGGEFSSGLLRAYYRARGIRQTFTLPDSPQQNGIAERRIGMVMDVAGSRAFVRDLSADKLSPRATPCVFLGFPLDAPGWLFYHPTSRRVLSSQDVTFDESVPYYRLFPYRTPSLPRHRSSLCQVPPR